MATKENKGGLLTAAEIEQDLEAKGRIDNPTGYSGVQDTGDKQVRQLGTDVQKGMAWEMVKKRTNKRMFTRR